MPTNIRIIHARDFIVASPEGKLDLAKTKELLANVASSEAPGIKYDIILDTRKADPELSATDLWQLASELGDYREGLRKGFSGKTAVICPHERRDNAAFFALCAQNRGLRVEAFISFEDAFNWLTADGDPA
jgi:hypothetical protein